jgi:hypothetical protein
MSAWRPRFGPMTVRFGPPLLPSEREWQGTGPRPHERTTDALERNVAALTQYSDPWLPLS